jgi:hypothetical protein
MELCRSSHVDGISLLGLEGVLTEDHDHVSEVFGRFNEFPDQALEMILVHG